MGARGRPLTPRHIFESDICLRGSRDQIVLSNQRRLGTSRDIYGSTRARPGPPFAVQSAGSDL